MPLVGGAPGLRQPVHAEDLAIGALAAASRLYTGANVAMGIRMMNDMTFDSAPATHDFGWNPRAFNPTFD